MKTWFIYTMTLYHDNKHHRKRVLYSDIGNDIVDHDRGKLIKSVLFCNNKDTVANTTALEQ